MCVAKISFHVPVGDSAAGLLEHFFFSRTFLPQSQAPPPRPRCSAAAAGAHAPAGARRGPPQCHLSGWPRRPAQPKIRRPRRGQKRVKTLVGREPADIGRPDAIQQNFRQRRLLAHHAVERPGRLVHDRGGQGALSSDGQARPPPRLPSGLGRASEVLRRGPGPGYALRVVPIAATR